MCVCVHVHSTGVDIRKQQVGVPSPSTVWVPVIKFRL